MKTEEIVSEVRSNKQARRVIAELLLRYGSDASRKRLKKFSRTSHQSSEEAAVRTAGNLLNSFVDRKPSGYVFTDYTD